MRQFSRARAFAPRSGLPTPTSIKLSMVRRGSKQYSSRTFLSVSLGYLAGMVCQGRSGTPRKKENPIPDTFSAQMYYAEQQLSGVLNRQRRIVGPGLATFKGSGCLATAAYEAEGHGYMLSFGDWPLVPSIGLWHIIHDLLITVLNIIQIFGNISSRDLISVVILLFTERIWAGHRRGRK